jgi:predicted DsbA family dithiol-disulfide isomerase
MPSPGSRRWFGQAIERKRLREWAILPQAGGLKGSRARVRAPRSALATMDSMNRPRVDIWSDIACPWCYVGKRRFEAALARFPERERVEVVWRAFELNPAAPRENPASPSYVERLAQKYGMSVTQAADKIASMVETARGEGLDFHFEAIRAGNTFDAHQLLHLARERGVQDAVKERLLRAYLTEGEAIGQPEVLIRLAAECGLSAEEASDALASARYGEAVRADEREARELGIGGVPFFVFAERYAVSGAQPAAVLLAALGQAWTEVNAEPPPLAEGAACGPDGCI